MLSQIKISPTSVVKDFRDFILRGNVVDMAIGVIIGAAFGKIVTSMVDDMIMPPIGFLLGKVDFSSLFIVLNGEAYKSVSAAKAAGAPIIAYGQFLNQVIGFLITAAAIFFIVRQVGRFIPKPVAPATKDCPRCLSKIPSAATKCPQCTADL